MLHSYFIYIFLLKFFYWGEFLEMPFLVSAFLGLVAVYVYVFRL